MERKMCNQCHSKMALYGKQQCSGCLGKMSSRDDSEYRNNRSIIFLEWSQGVERHCWLCHKEVLRNPSADHVIPLSQGGTNSLGNLRLTHLDCNRKRR